MESQKQSKKIEDKWIAELEEAKKKVREKQEGMSTEEKQRLKELHWMKCPKCGMDLVEKELDGVMIDHCSECGVTVFDDGELDQVQGAKNSGLSKFLQILKS